MNPDRTNDPGDARLSALYREHIMGSVQPSAAADARILTLARGAALRPATGWRSWLGASWFGPGLAFATLASLSVVIVALLPKEDMSVERDVAMPGSPATAPLASAPPAAVESKSVASGTSMTSAVVMPEPLPGASASPAAQVPASQAPALNATAKSKTASGSVSSPAFLRAPMTAPESSVVRGGSNAQSVARGPVQASGSPARVPDSAVSAAGVAESRAKLARSNDASSAQQSEASGSAPRARQSRPPGSAFELDKRSDAAVAPAPKAIAPNPFPAAPPPSAAARGRLGADAPSGSGNAAVPLTPGSAAAPFARDNAQAALAPQSARAREPAPATADADPAQRLEKPSLLSEPTESRMANQPVPEVHDSAPTYPNEMRPSLPLPYTYTVPRAATRESASKSAAAPGSGAAPPSAAAVGALASRSATVASAAQQSSAIRKEEALERRAPEKAASSMPAAPATMFAAAPPPRDPVQWIKDIQKLRSEGKAEQVTKELAEFRKQYPQYLLPDELKNIK